MENASKKSLSDSILEFTKNSSADLGDTASATAKAVSSTASSVTSAVTSTASSVESKSGGFLGINIFVWIIIIILVLAFLGFNIFTYLSKGTNDVNSVLAPLFQKIFGTAAATTSQTVNVAATGGKAVVSGTATGINTGLTAVQNVTPTTASSSVPSNSVETQKDTQQAENSLNKVLNSPNYNNASKLKNDYEPNEASSSVHTTGKAGWCFIGDDRGIRTCGKVGVNDTCMSGDIFPTQELCVNPTLRA